MPKYGFKFLSGKYQDGEFPIPDAGELFIGRGTELDMVLAEDMVSRKHARLVVQGDELLLYDLKSTNGTFVNGEKIEKAQLHLHDRVLIGTSILKVIQPGREETTGNHVPSNSSEDKQAIHQMMQDLAQRPARGSSLRGDLEEVALPDLLQLFATNKRTGQLVLKSTLQGKLVVKDGQIWSIDIPEKSDLAPMARLQELLSWQHGTFEFDPNTALPNTASSFETSTENALIEAMRLKDEAARMRQILASGRPTVRWGDGIMPKLSSLSPDMLDLLQLALCKQQTQKILEATHTAPPGQTAERLQQLIQYGFLQIVS